VSVDFLLEHALDEQRKEREQRVEKQRSIALMPTPEPNKKKRKSRAKLASGLPKGAYGVPPEAPQVLRRRVGLSFDLSV